MSNKIINLSQEEATKIFPKEKNIDMTKLLTTTEGVYSVSKNRSAKKLMKIIYKCFKTYDITITDACSNVGSDTLMLAKYFTAVNAIELDKTNYNALENNVNVYNYKNIKLINGSNLKELQNLKQDVIYADPPWGGPSYKNYAQLKLYFDKVELADFFIRYKNNAKIHIYKVPYNYNINNFITKTKVTNLRIYNYKEYDRTKFLFLIIINK
jgi:tRNA/tmRNA/rRNA uracil-C5-methylase (TrmA/RlmC/RlmD family)